MTSLDSLLSTAQMLAAWRRRDRSFDGLFVLGVRTTGIFCRPSCPSQPNEENLEFLDSPASALAAGYRPCKRCHPTLSLGQRPEWVQRLMAHSNQHPTVPIRASDLKRWGLTPERVRRWFATNLGQTFAQWQREQRLGSALHQLAAGGSIDDAVHASAFESHSGFRTAFARLFDNPPGTASEKDCICTAWYETPLGPMIGLADETGLRALEFAQPDRMRTLAEEARKRFGKTLLHRSNETLMALGEELRCYFGGTLRRFQTHLELQGTSFQLRVWEVLREIPFGETASYAEVATQVGDVRAVRAVARANATNPVYLLVPCHRVISKAGGISGYGGGVWRKRALIRLEREGNISLTSPPGKPADAG